MKKKLNEEGYEKVTGFRAIGGSPGQWTQWGGPKGYSRNDYKTKAELEKEPESVVDPHIEQQLIDQAISILFNDHPELVNNKKIRRHHIQMLIGKVTSGEVSDLITMKQFIKSLKKRGVTVESEMIKMKIRKDAIKELVKEVIEENKEVLAEAAGLDHYLSGEYDDYEYGDPVAAAKSLKTMLKSVERALSGYDKAIKKAGAFIGPGLHSAFRQDILEMIDNRIGR